MRINITAQAKDRASLIRILWDILKMIIQHPGGLGQKYRTNDMGYTWEFVPDEHEPAKPEPARTIRGIQVDTRR